ncbi:nucleotidyltransferase family protein [Ectothiorhodospira variabilis]|uniref:nucleotidyltransferase domain-containing protein n=1 Tax=Ectothiorhodospira variabilis TaxID=505694 RepID=UPI001EFB50F3|nr:nucleotidyltransferase family protein [Ectothiorhodospira variabilis]MCG5495347.1 nucleotidyltransferase family protein [Ectothiorhodospira variabilis]MCG5504945.1 nucleotidyltransferase family protein [Ectothiorhodospira variabilis]MCG5508102.1 nucleotidyltransferase family protein [Ectothiorhodospira variabilis]
MRRFRSLKNLQQDPTQALCDGLAQPKSLLALSGKAWTGVLAVGRENLLLGALWQRAVEAGVSERLPQWAARHLWGAALTAETNAAALRWELEHLDRGVIRQLSPPLVLKGGAYVLDGLPNAAGRIAADIDLLFRRDEVERAETVLYYEGWFGTHHTPYDQRYYREWMHELPPLQHVKRGTTLDLHHNILPATFAVVVDPERLLEAAQPVEGMNCLHLPAPRHLVLHAIVHLFSETDWDRGLRDLYDIHTLIEHYQTQYGPAFFDELLEEAEALGVGWLMEPAIWCCQNRFRTQVPDGVRGRLRDHAARLPARWLGHRMFHHALNGRISATPRTDALARSFVFLRGHWLKMPPLLLARHLFYKAFLAPREDDEGPAQNAQQRQ